MQGVPARQPDVKEEHKGPRVGAPEGAIAGFLKAAGLASIERGHDPEGPDKKGDFYVAVIEKPGRPAIEVIGEIVPEVVRTFPWPKSMRWGARRRKPGALGWVRPLHSIVATFGPETEEPEIVPFAIDGIASGDTTRGHRFLAPRRVQGAPASTTTWPSSKRPRSCSIRRGAARSSWPTPRTSPSRRATNWSRTRACWTRSPAWSNGRWC